MGSCVTKCSRNSVHQQTGRANNDVKEALKIELDIPSLEQHFGDGEALVKCASDSQPIVPENIWSQNEISAAENKLISDLSNSDIREQINAEIKALRSQLVRSHALLSYLQTKEKPLSKVSSSDAQPCHQKSLDDQHMKDSFFEQSFDGQVPSRYYRSHRGSSSNTSHRSTPLHRSSRAQSCPILSIESSAVSKSTQTDPQREKGITWKNIGDHEDKATSKLPQAFKNGSVCELTKETRFAQYPYTSEIMHEGIKDFECGICEVHRSSEDPASPQFPRHRTNSFLAAVKIGNPNLVDASMDNDSGDNMHNQHHPLSKNIELEEIRHPYFGSSSTILKGFVPISKEMADVMESNKECVLPRKLPILLEEDSEDSSGDHIKFFGLKLSPNRKTLQSSCNAQTQTSIFFAGTDCETIDPSPDSSKPSSFLNTLPSDASLRSHGYSIISQAVPMRTAYSVELPRGHVIRYPPPYSRKTHKRPSYSSSENIYFRDLPPPYRQTQIWRWATIAESLPTKSGSLRYLTPSSQQVSSLQTRHLSLEKQESFTSSCNRSWYPESQLSSVTDCSAWMTKSDMDLNNRLEFRTSEPPSYQQSLSSVHWNQSSKNRIASNPMDHQRFSENLQMPEVWKNANPDKDKGQNEGNLMSESDDGKSKNERDKSFKTSQRSMRRGSGAGSPNSLTCIPRCPAFDFSEQEEDHSLLTSTSEPEANQDIKPEILQGIQSTIAAGDGDSLQKSPTLRLKDTSQKKREASKSKTLMPELMENSETESAKGSFEYEVPEMPTTTTAEVPPPLPVPDTPFPNLPNSLLLKLGVNKESSVHVESFDEQELESKFMTLALAFKTDKMTLSKRLEIQKRQRDIAEKDIENEMKTLKDSLNSLSLNATSTETRDLIGKVLNHVDIVQQATSRISARSETFGAVQQEERVNRAFEVLMLHVENLKRLFDKEHKELEETRRMLTDTRSPRKEFGHGEGTLEERKKSLKTFGIAVGTIKSVFSLSALLSIFRLSLKVGRRRASVADFNQHSLADGQRTPSLSRSWTSGFKVDSKSRLISALCPFTSTSSVDLNSSSSSTSLPTAITPSHSGLYPPDTNSRRCSLPASPLRNTPVKNSFRVSETMIGESSRLCGLQPKNINSRKISTTRTLYSVTDEKEQSDGENETEMLTITKPTETIPSIIDEHEHSNCEMHLTEIHNEEIKRNSEKERCDSSDTEYENSDDESKQPRQSLRLAEKYFPSSMLCVWKNTSTLTLCRYSISFFLALMAFVILLMTIVPSDFSSADGSCVHDIAEVLAGKLFHVQRGYKTI